MAPAEFAFAVISGITVAGLCGSVLELATGRPVSFGARIGTRSQFLAFALSTVVAGPMMLANDALAAHREGMISGLYLWFCGLTALVWASALGVIALRFVMALLSVGFHGCWC